MKPLLLGLFTLVLVFVWIFFVIASIHSKKFANFSNYINKNTTFLFIFLLFLSISGYLIIIFGDFSKDPIGKFFGSKSAGQVNLDINEIDFSNTKTY
ncbi:hypothetical protein DLH72_04675 [Candidatus Gracilibacteria bacterium]|nr:MAG: hypothetical protein DLH72_04675 [Candidatus Gracilibacteria bacterium]